MYALGDPAKEGCPCGGKHCTNSSYLPDPYSPQESSQPFLSASIVGRSLALWIQSNILEKMTEMETIGLSINTRSCMYIYICIYIYIATKCLETTHFRKLLMRCDRFKGPRLGSWGRRQKHASQPHEAPGVACIAFGIVYGSKCVWVRNKPPEVWFQLLSMQGSIVYLFLDRRVIF